MLLLTVPGMTSPISIGDFAHKSQDITRCQELRMAARRRMTAVRRERMRLHSSRARRECAAGGARCRSATAVPS